MVPVLRSEDNKDGGKTMMTKEEICRDYKLAANKIEQIKTLAELNACTKQQIADILIEDGQEVPKWYQKKEGPQEPKKVTVEELDDWTQKIVEQQLMIEALTEQNNALVESNAALIEKLNGATEAVNRLGKEIHEKDEQIKDLRNLLDDQMETKEQNRKYQQIILKMTAELYDAH